MNIAVITGASSGIGKEFAIELDKKGLDEIWIIARRAGRLKDLKKIMKTPVRTIRADLTKTECIRKYKKLLKKEKPTVRYLVNASGFGKFGMFEKISMRDTLDMIDLNVKALVAITGITLKYIKNGGKIIQMCSSSAFTPLPYMNIYASTKAFILHFSKALRTELRPQNINITAVCPYFVDTEFIGIAEQKTPGLKKYIPLYKPEQIAKKAIYDSDNGRSMSVCGAFTNFFRYSSKIFPEVITTAIWKSMLTERTKK